MPEQPDLRASLIKALTDKYGTGHPWQAIVPDMIGYLIEWMKQYSLPAAVPPPPGPPLEKPPKG